MKHSLKLTFLTAILLTPLASFAQAKPEVANATKAAKRAWESAPAEKKALWQQQREALKHIERRASDLSALAALHAAETSLIQITDRSVIFKHTSTDPKDQANTVGPQLR
jgi:hypothetical protein